MRCCLRIVPVLLILLTVHPKLHGASKPHPFTPTLAQLTRRSGYIFAGTVVHVGRAAKQAANEVDTVEIQFRVDQAVLGVHAKQILYVREWMGLWNSGERYQVGERVLLFLYPSSKLGLTSPVAGAFGRFSLNASGQILIGRTRLSALRGGLPKRAPGRSEVVAVAGRDFVRAIRRAGAKR